MERNRQPVALNGHGSTRGDTRFVVQRDDRLAMEVHRLVDQDGDLPRILRSLLR